MPDDNKKYLLDVIQAWVNLKVRVASFVLIGNGAVLGTAVAFIKEKGDLTEGLFALKISAFGILLGAVALWIAYSYFNSYLTIQFEGKPKPAKAVKPKKEPTKRQLEIAAKMETMDFSNKSFKFFVFCSGLCLILSIAYLSGVVEGCIDCAAKHPGCEEILNKR
jgi:hypothetical protein